MKELAQKSQVTLMISSHDLSHVTEVCNRIVVLEKGQLIRDMNTEHDTLIELESYFKAQLNLAHKAESEAEPQHYIILFGIWKQKNYLF